MTFMRLELARLYLNTVASSPPSLVLHIVFLCEHPEFHGEEFELVDGKYLCSPHSKLVYNALHVS